MNYNCGLRKQLSLIFVLGYFFSSSPAEAQWTHRYPKISGYSHHVYVEGYELPTLTSGPMDPAVSPNGTQVAFSARGWIWLFDPVSGVARQMTSGAEMDFRPTWSPDSNTLAFVRDDGSDTDIVLLDLVTSEERVAVEEYEMDLDPVFSNDGPYQYYSSATSGDFDLWRLNLESDEKQRVTDARGFERAPRMGAGNSVYYLKKSFSGDGIVQLAFSEDNPVPAGHINRELLSAWIASQGSFDVSPDGATLAYTWPDEDRYELRLMDLDQPSGSVLLTTGDGLPLAPAWSADGRWIWFVEGTDTQSTTLKRISVSGGPVEVIPVKSWDWHPEIGTVRITSTIDGEFAPARLNVLDASGHAAVPDSGSIRFDGRNGRVFFYSPGTIDIQVPAGQAVISAVQGLLTPEVTAEVQVAPGQVVEVDLALNPVWNPGAEGWHAGDHHFHLNYGGSYDLDPEDIYLDLQAEAMDVAVPLLANLHNRFPDQDLWDWERKPEDPMLVFGQEVRSHFLGHLNVLGTNDLYWPWVWGPGYQVYGSDDRTNAEVLDAIHAQGGIGGYVHPVGVTDPFVEGMETRIPLGLIADAVLGKVDVLEIGCLWTNPVGTAEVWHRLLNMGIPIAASAGTDVMNNFYRTMAIGTTRMYVRLDEGPLDYTQYLDALRAGQSFVTNGPMLDFSVNGKRPGEVVPVSDSASWKLDVYSAVPYDSVAIFVNGEVIWNVAASTPSDSTQFSGTLELPEGGWISARVYGEGYTWPMMDGYVFAQTSPVWIGSVGSTDQAAVHRSAAELLRALNAADLAVQTGYAGTSIPNLQRHFERARQVLRGTVEER